MSTIDLSQAAGFKAVDSEGNELGIVSMNDIVDAVKQSINQQSVTYSAQVSTLADDGSASTQSATDTYEDKLPQKTDATWIRGLDAEGNPILISKESLSSVLGGLIEPSLTGGVFIRKIYTSNNYCLKIAKASIKGNAILLYGGRVSSLKGANIRKIQGDETSYILKITSDDVDPHAREDNDYLYINLAGILDSDGGAWNVGFLISYNEVEYGFTNNTEQDAIKALPTVTPNKSTLFTK